MTLLALLLVLPLLTATMVVVIEVGLGLMPAGNPAEDPPFSGTATVLIPAHDEAAGLGETLGRLLARVGSGVSVLVVADNCSDATAAIARAAGAEAIERFDAARPGKGHALAFGRDHLAADPPDCVIVVDADTAPDDDRLVLLAARACRLGRPVQAAYMIEPPAGAASTVRFSAAAVFVKNIVRQLGGRRLGAPALLTGSGMALPWPIFAGLPLATGHVTEDLMLGVTAALQATPPVFAPDVRVSGVASSAAGTTTQRRRWESGFVDTARSFAGPLLRGAWRLRRPGLMWLALHLMTPPLLLLLALDAAATLLLGLLIRAGVAPWLPALLATATAAAVGLVLAALLRHGRGDLLAGWRDVPSYVIWKVKLTISILVKRERRWIRTDRD